MAHEYPATRGGISQPNYPFLPVLTRRLLIKYVTMSNGPQVGGDAPGGAGLRPGDARGGAPMGGRDARVRPEGVPYRARATGLFT